MLQFCACDSSFRCCSLPWHRSKGVPRYLPFLRRAPTTSSSARTPCTFASTSNVLVRGSLILEAQPFQPPNLPESALRPPYSGPFGIGDLLLRRGAAANACFVLETLKRNQTGAGLIPIGFPAWSQVGNTIAFRLYASPDAGYEASVTLTGEGFRGTGSTSGVGDGGTPPSSWTPDVIVGRRTGSADRSICTRAVEGAARR
jgi:hypothetical protein